jgi:hypothetical protein
VAVWSCRVDWLWSVVDVDLYFECRWGILHEGLVPSALVQCGQVGGLMADQVESRREGCPLRVVLCHDECKNATRSTSAPMFRILVSALGCMVLVLARRDVHRSALVLASRRGRLSRRTGFSAYTQH